MKDDVGNWANGSWSFTVDTTQDFTVDPSFDDGPGAVKWSEDYSLGFDIQENSESADVTVSCLDSGGDTIDTDTLSDGAVTASCDIDDEYEDSTVDLSVEVCDQAGNCDTSGESTFTFDSSQPNVFESNIPGSVVNSDFPVEFTASDASGIQELEYFYDDSTVNEGSGTSVDIDGSSGEFTASVNGLSEGQHTVYFRVKDEAGRWSSTESLEFDYRPDAQPEITMEAPSSISVTAGDSTGFQVNVKNTGDIFIGSSNITASAEGVFSDSKTVEELAPTNSTTVSFSVSTVADDLGKHTITLSVSNPETSKTIGLVVEATSQQESSLDTKLSDYETKLQQLQQKVEAKKGDLPKDLESRLEANLSGFRQKVQDARQAKQNGNYYRVSSSLEGIESDYQAAQSSFENVKKADNRRDTRRWMMIGGGLVLLLAIAGGGFYYYENDREFDFDFELDLGSGDEDSDEGPGFVSNFMDRLSALTNSKEEEAEEFQWDGFKN
ncbi:MAG: CARDB domain-containing protein [Candidatus Nanohaloarchaea archaeon]